MKQIRTIIIIAFTFMLFIVTPLAMATPQYHLTVNVIPLGSGTVIKNPDKEWYYNENVELTAIPGPGWGFNYWWPGGSTSKTFTIHMDKNYSTTAYFQYVPVINSFTVAPITLPAGGGNVTLAWTVQHTTSISLYLNGQWIGDYDDAVPNMMLGISQTTTAYIIAHQIGMSETATSGTITIIVAGSGQNNPIGQNGDVKGTNIQGMNWLLIIIPLVIIIIGGILYSQWIKKKGEKIELSKETFKNIKDKVRNR
jgi:hypothetical protein